MKSLCIAASAFACVIAASPPPAAAQKIIVIKATTGAFAHTVRVRKFGYLVRGPAQKPLARVLRHGRIGPMTLALPQQRLFPSYYEAGRSWTVGPDMESGVQGGRTVEGGSRYGGHIAPGRTVENGSPLASHIGGGRTVERGSRYRSHIEPGNTVEQGSPWGSTMGNWRFTGYAAPVRPRGIAYFRAPWR